MTPPTELIKKIEPFLAVTEKEAGIKVSRELPKEYDDKIEDIEIFVRPF